MHADVAMMRGRHALDNGQPEAGAAGAAVAALVQADEGFEDLVAVPGRYAGPSSSTISS